MSWLGLALERAFGLHELWTQTDAQAAAASGMGAVLTLVSILTPPAVVGLSLDALPDLLHANLSILLLLCRMRCRRLP